MNDDLLPVGVTTCEIMGAIIRRTMMGGQEVGKEVVIAVHCKSGSGNIVIPLTNELREITTSTILAWCDVLSLDELSSEEIRGIIGLTVRVRVKHWLDRKSRKNQSVEPLQLIATSDLSKFETIFDATRIGKVPD